MRSCHQRTYKAFTLTELIIVVAIITLIAALAIPNYKKTIRKVQERRAILNLTTIHGANEIYRARSADEYWPGPGANLAAINAGLSLNISHDEMNYTYTRTNPTKYAATASWTGDVNFTVRTNQESLSAGGGGNPCCSAGTCLIVLTCT